MRKCQRCDLSARKMRACAPEPLAESKAGARSCAPSISREKTSTPPRLRRLPDGVEDGSVLGKRSAPDYGDTPRAWKGIEQQLQPFTAQRCLAVGDAREIAAGPGKVSNESLPHRVSDESEDNGRYDTGLFQRADGW